MKKQFYLIHKWVGLISFLAIVIWNLSGFLHPIMSWTQPRPVQPFLKLAPIESEKLKVSLSEALAKNNIKTFGGFNFVSFNGQTFYQILPDNPSGVRVESGGEDCHSSVISDTISSELPIYLNAETGEKLENGDEKYAEYLARYFADEQKAEITSNRLLSEFSLEYRSVNRMLPVYEVKFNRADGMKAYVETNNSKLGTLIDTKKSWFQWAFMNLHDFELFGMPNFSRKVVVTILMIFALFTSLSGLLIYGLFWKVYGKQKTLTQRAVWRKYHRVIGVTVSIFALAWAVSGIFHLLAKQDLNELAKVSVASTYKSEKLSYSLTQILQNEQKIVGATLVGFNGKMFYRVLKANQEVSYFNAETGELLENGDNIYAEYLAEKFSGLKNPVSVTPIKQFEGEYNFIMKRLPVVKVQYAENSKERYYVDTAEGKLALKINNGLSQWEDFSFDYLHKGHFLDWAGKYIRDTFLMLVALVHTLVGSIGVWLFFGLKRNKSELK